MNVTHGNCSLYLCPTQHDWKATDNEKLYSTLQDIGLISQRIEHTDDAFETRSFSAGEKFLDYIAYLGCAPAIQFEADNDNKNFSFIRLHHYPQAELIHSMVQSRAPHCPACKQPVKNWATNKTTSQIHCEQCDTTSAIELFNWRKMAGYAQLFIEVTDIFPKEALPQQILLNKLSDITGTQWQYFYSCQ